MIKKVAFAGLLAAATVLGNVGATSLATNSSTGINLVQSCNLSLLASVVNIGDLAQGSEQGDCGGETVNESTGLNLLQLCNTNILASVLNIGLLDQAASQGDCGASGDNGGGDYDAESSGGNGGNGDDESGPVNSSTGINLVQLSDTNIGLSGVNVGALLQSIGTP